MRDPRSTGVVTVALPEEMPVTETLEFRERLRDDMGMAIDTVVVNALYPERFRGEEARAPGRARRTPGTTTARRAPRCGPRCPSTTGRATQRTQLRRLRKEVDGSVTLPFLFEPELGLEEFERLSRELERRL